MSYAKIRQAGFPFGSKLLSSEMTQFDTNMSTALNGAQIYTYVDNTSSGGDSVDTDSFVQSVNGTNWTKSAEILVDCAGMATGDVLLCSLHLGGVRLSGFGTSAPEAYLRLLARDDQSGTPTETAVTGSHAKLFTNTDEGSGADIWPVHLAGKHTVTEPGTTRIVLEVRLALAVGAFTVTVLSGVFLRAQRV